jgi:hypothetical protein
MSQEPRKAGALKGKIWMAQDFDEWPEDILEAFEALASGDIGKTEPCYILEKLLKGTTDENADESFDDGAHGEELL